MSATPTCLTGALDVSKAHEKGFAFGAAGLSRDTNPHSPFGSERRLCVAWDEGWRDGWGSPERTELNDELRHRPD